MGRNPPSPSRGWDGRIPPPAAERGEPRAPHTDTATERRPEALAGRQQREQMWERQQPQPHKDPPHPPQASSVPHSGRTPSPHTPGAKGTWGRSGPTPQPPSIPRSPHPSSSREGRGPTPTPGAHAWGRALPGKRCCQRGRDVEPRGAAGPGGLRAQPVGVPGKRCYGAADGRERPGPGSGPAPGCGTAPPRPAPPRPAARRPVRPAPTCSIGPLRGHGPLPVPPPLPLSAAAAAHARRRPAHPGSGVI